VYFVRPLTAEEIAQRREALKQRLAEKKKEQTSQDNVNASSELSSGNIDWSIVGVIFDVVCMQIISEFLIHIPCRLFTM